MNLLIKSSTTFIASLLLLATSGVNAGCTDPDGPGPTTGMKAAKLIVLASDWYVDNCPPMYSMSPIDPEEECKDYAINYCIGHITDAVTELGCIGNPPDDLLNSWSDECSEEVEKLMPNNLSLLEVSASCKSIMNPYF